MKNSKFDLKMGIAVITTIAGQSAMAETWTVPRAHDISPVASNCAIGPFQQTNKAGPYNVYCTRLTDGEKCLALIKNYMNREGVLSKVDSSEDTARMKYCLNDFYKELLIQN